MRPVGRMPSRLEFDIKMALPSQEGVVDQAGGWVMAVANDRRFEKSHRPELERLANALSALYRKGSDEKRLLESRLLAIPR